MATLNMDWFKDLFSFGRRSDPRKFRSLRDAYEFVQRAYREDGGPTPELRAMHRRYLDFKMKKDANRENSDRAA